MMTILLTILEVLLIAFGIFLFMKRKEILNLADEQAKEMINKAKGDVLSYEERIARLKIADKEISARLKEARAIIENITDMSSVHAANIELITEEDLLSSQEYQADRKEVRSKLRKLACNAITGVRGSGADVNIGKFIAISAKADMAGALLLTTVEMLCSKVTPNNGREALEKLQESILAAESLIKSMDSRASVDKEFRSSLSNRLQIEINFKKAKQKAKEEQKELREQEKEERKARQEAEKIQQEAEKEEEIKQQAILEIEQKLNEQNESDRAVYEEQLKKLQEELAEVHAKAERARSRAQETKQGHVYVISNIGSFGDEILKIGMTRRLNPIDRVKELGDASVPFTFDIHALIESENAPELEKNLHKIFSDRRVNKVNMRKEYFRVHIDEIELKLAEIGIEALINKIPSADEYYQTITIEDAVS
ncbi:MAG: GIY-YIG nuclease family protein [Sulfuriflexus sp.]|nr:GIY-YIG nuclease family protein [Sulfuriflexus sp.]